MTLSDWLSNISPDAAIGALTLATGLGGWLFAKARGKKTQSFESLITDVLENFLHELLDDYTDTDSAKDYLKHAREYIETRAWAVLAKRGVPKNAVTTSLLHAGIEKATAKLGNLIAQRTIPPQIDSLFKKAAELAKLWPSPKSEPSNETPPQ